MFGTVDYMAGTTHVQDHVLRPPNIPAEYAAFDPVYVRVTYATGGIVELRSIFGLRDSKIWVIAEEQWDHPPKMLMNVQSYFVEPGSGLGVPYFPATMAVGEQSNFAGTAKWNWGLSLDEPRASGTFNYTTATVARADRKLTLYETYDFPQFQRNYVFGAGMESLIDLSPTHAPVVVVPPDPGCPDDTPCPAFAGFWVRHSLVRDADERYCFLVRQKDGQPSPRGIIEYPQALTICKVQKAVQLDGVTLALKP